MTSTSQAAPPRTPRGRGGLPHRLRRGSGRAPAWARPALAALLGGG